MSRESELAKAKQDAFEKIEKISEDFLSELNNIVKDFKK